MISALLLAAALPALPFTIDGGDLERIVRNAGDPRLATALAAALKDSPPLPCPEAVALERESQRLLRNTSITGALVAVSHFGLDLGSTAWADNRAACRNVPAGQSCLVEWNTLTPSSGGVFAAKVVIVGGVTGASWYADKKGHRGWATFFRWLGVLGGVVPTALNIHKGLTVEKARAAQ